MCGAGAGALALGGMVGAGCAQTGAETASAATAALINKCFIVSPPSQPRLRTLLNIHQGYNVNLAQLREYGISSRGPQSSFFAASTTKCTGQSSRTVEKGR